MKCYICGIAWHTMREEFSKIVFFKNLFEICWSQLENLRALISFCIGKIKITYLFLMQICCFPFITHFLQCVDFHAQIPVSFSVRNFPNRATIFFSQAQFSQVFINLLRTSSFNDQAIWASPRSYCLCSLRCSNFLSKCVCSTCDLACNHHLNASFSSNGKGAIFRFQNKYFYDITLSAHECFLESFSEKEILSEDKICSLHEWKARRLRVRLRVKSGKRCIFDANVAAPGECASRKRAEIVQGGEERFTLVRFVVGGAPSNNSIFSFQTGS